ncbi:MAG: hypothetical protein QNJ97_10265 [Myxococcota bacterium]|nr:hypothetical protein [Myxococcota bacterium]
MKTCLIGAIGILSIALFTSSCTKKFIPNTEIEDTERNRAVIAFCERYRRAVEDMNIGLLLSLASPKYFDNGGTTTGDDDMDRTGLEAVLKERFKAVQNVRHEVKYRDIREQAGITYVEYTWTTHFQYEISGKTKWVNKTTDNRLELEHIDDGFLILSGM